MCYLRLGLAPEQNKKARRVVNPFKVGRKRNSPSIGPVPACREVPAPLKTNCGRALAACQGYSGKCGKKPSPSLLLCRSGNPAAPARAFRTDLVQYGSAGIGLRRHRTTDLDACGFMFMSRRLHAHTAPRALRSEWYLRQCGGMQSRAGAAGSALIGRSRWAGQGQWAIQHGVAGNVTPSSPLIVVSSLFGFQIG